MLAHAPRATAPRATAPTTLGLADLTALTRRVADEVRAGMHPYVVDPDQRWYRLLQSDGYVDVWLISWATEQYADLHDHAGSLGALTVVAGSLVERRWVAASGSLRSRRIRAGRSVGFPLGHVHDVANPSPVATVSVHAYSPPLSAMSYYSVEPGARLRRTRTVLTGPGEGVG